MEQSDKTEIVTQESINEKLDELLMATIEKTLEGVAAGDRSAVDNAIKLLTTHKKDSPKKKKEGIKSGNPDDILGDLIEDPIKDRLPSNRRNR